MKAKSKILVLVLSLALLVASVIGISVSAEADSTPEIAGMNFSYEDNTYIWYAVKATANVTAENTTMAVYKDAGCTEALQTGITGTTETITMLGGDYIIFKAAPIKAKDITKVIYAQATTGENKSAVVAYSLAEYLLERLYVSERQGAEVLAEEKALYESLLQYGADAQNLFNNLGKEDAEKETLATALKIVKIFNGTLSFDGTQAIVASGTAVTFTANDSAATKWEVIKIAADGTETKTAVAAGDTVTVDAHTIIQQKQVAPALTFDKESDLNGFTFGTNYLVDDRIVAVDGVDTARQSQAFKIVDGALVFDSPLAHNNVLNIPRTGDATGNLKAVFEADITVDTTDVNDSTSYGGGQWLSFIFYDPSTGAQYGAFYIMFEDGATSSTVSEGTNQAAKNSDYFKDGVEFSLKLEYVINPSGWNNVYVYLKDAETGAYPEYTGTGLTWRTTWNATGSGWCNPDDIALKIDVARYQDIKITFDNVRFDGE